MSNSPAKFFVCVLALFTMYTSSFSYVAKRPQAGGTTTNCVKIEKPLTTAIEKRICICKVEFVVITDANGGIQAEGRRCMCSPLYVLAATLRESECSINTDCSTSGSPIGPCGKSITDTHPQSDWSDNGTGSSFPRYGIYPPKTRLW